MEIKQYITKLQRGYWRNKKRNQKIPRNKWQWKHEYPKAMGLSKSSSKREVYSDTIIPQKQEKHWIDSLTLHLKQLGKEDQKTSKSAEGRS